MIFLFEERPYDSRFLKTVIGYGDGKLKYRSKSGFNTETTKDGVKINGVGYCFYNGQPVFVLPKVFLDERGKKAFSEDIDPEGKDCFGNKKKEDQKISNVQRKFYSSISLWLYSAIDKYNKKKNDDKDNGIVTPQQSESRNFKKNDRYATLLDIMSSMELFYKKNQSLFVFIAKNKHSGYHKINWQRTVNKMIPFMQNGVPIYTNPVNKVKVFDLDDRLLVLYFSAMRFIQDKFGYTMPQSEFYQPLRMNEMDCLLENGRGLRELKKIKYKYFEDRLLKLYNIMEAFFRWGACYKNKNNDVQEYLIANSFNNVFEAMIDELVGDPEFADLKDNEDGKIIDHLYREKSLIFSSGNNDDIWHIGDSKYYQDPKDIKDASIAKQYTYAKNMIQNFFSPKYFHDGENHGANDAHYGIRYRDDLTEGYSVTPNFFIRGFIPKYKDASQYSSDYFIKQGDVSPLIRLAREKDQTNIETEEAMIERMWENRNRHFKNRLFDRDTLLLQIYDVNFLYVLKAFTSKHSSLREEFKNDARDKFRKNFLNLLDKKYNFYKIIPQNLDLNTFVDHRFKKWLGKMYCPEIGENKTFLIYAEEKDSDTLLNATTSNQRIRVIDRDEFICLPLSVQEAMNAASDREINPKVFVARGTLEMYEEIGRTGVVTLPIRNGSQDTEASCPKYLITLEDSQIRLFIIFGIDDYNDSSVRLQVIEQKLYAEKVFDCNTILTRADEFAGHLIRWNDLIFL
ncbi:MAG: LlaJI family restriction endonuclease [Fibrobacter sp.]|nr:LlaJI family restriction endonuclease [Fibrobacter sp.]